MSKKLKPCPFCGGDATICYYDTGDILGMTKGFGVQCKECFIATMPYGNTEKDAIREWNRRD